MPIRIDPATADAVLRHAITEALNDDAWVPGDWVERTRDVATSTSKTYIAALGTAILAKAVDARVDVMSIKATETEANAYSARNLCHNVLVPAAREFGFDLGATGREPLNNQPFFRYERIDAMDRVRDRAGLGRLLLALQAVAAMDMRDARSALAAYVRQRLAAAAEKQRVDIRGLDLGIVAAILAIRQFIDEDPEGGRRGQAAVAAVFDLAFQEVRMGRINDPSRRFPGDVQVLDGSQVVLAAEVRQKLVSGADALAFARVAADAGVGNALMVALHPNQPELDRADLLERGEAEYGVLLSVIDTVDELLASALLWSGAKLDTVIESMPNRVVARLEEIEVSPAGIRLWEELISADA
jgi:hypothetical protein